MSYTTKVILIASIGFIIMGFIFLKNNKIKQALKECGLYRDAEGFIKFNGCFNISIGIIGILLTISNHYLASESVNIVAIFGVLIIILIMVQSIYSKKYKK